MLKSKKRRRQEAMSRVPSSTRLVAYLPSFKNIVQRLRATSATPSLLQLGHTSLPRPTAQIIVFEDFDKLLQSQRGPKAPNPFRDILVTPSSPLAAQLSLPSSPHPPPSFSSYTMTTPTATPTTSCSVPLPSATPDTATNEEDLLRSNEDGEEEVEEEEEEMVRSFLSGIRNKPDGTVECVVQMVPDFLVANLLQLFPGVMLKEREMLSVIVLSQRTVNDMTSWSTEVEQEREQLLEYFIDSAKEVCSRLNGGNHWADFIDPSSGRAYYSPYSSSTLYETDDRYRYLGGFDILDLGCCKCIRHPFWGAFAFVGSVFTTAPLNSPAIQSIIEL